MHAFAFEEQIKKRVPFLGQCNQPYRSAPPHNLQSGLSCNAIIHNEYQFMHALIYKVSIPYYKKKIHWTNICQAHKIIQLLCITETLSKFHQCGHIFNAVIYTHAIKEKNFNNDRKKVVKIYSYNIIMLPQKNLLLHHCESSTSKIKKTSCWTQKQSNSSLSKSSKDTQNSSFAST